VSQNSSPLIINCEVFENYALYGAGIDCFMDCSPTIFNTLIYHNQGAGGGSAMAVCYDSNPKLINVTAVENYSDQDVGGIHIADAHPEIINSIFWNNEDYDIYLLSFQDYDNEVTIRNSLIDGGLEGIGNYDINEVYWQEGNIDLEPEFSHDQHGQFQLFVDSPCIDTGTENVHHITFPLNDLIGNDRVNGVTIDMGCYEFQQNSAHNVFKVISDQKLMNYPNPFNPTTSIRFSIPKKSWVELAIYNIKGQKIKTLLNQRLKNGDHSMIWGGDNESGDPVGSGVYIIKLRVKGKDESVKRTLLLK